MTTTLNMIWEFFNLLFLSLAKFWPWCWSAFVYTTTNATLEFEVLFFFIALSLVLNSLNNLIYKVLNLGILSILVAAVWAYMTDLSFVYVVYILAFVGAVIMLFLSVVLMLPSSAVVPIKKHSFLPLLSMIDDLWSFIRVIARIIGHIYLLLVGSAIAVVIIIASVIAIMLILYFFVAIMFKIQNVGSLGGHDKELECTEVSFVPVRYGKAAHAYKFFNMRAFTSNYDFLVYKNVQINNRLFNSRKPRYMDGYSDTYGPVKPGVVTVGVPAELGRKVYIAAFSKTIFFQDKPSGSALKFIGQAIQEFLEYYFIVVEQLTLRVRLKWSVKRLLLLRLFAVGIHDDAVRSLRSDFRNAAFNRDCRRIPIHLKEYGNDRDVIIELISPWWSPFNVLARQSFVDALDSLLRHCKGWLLHKVAIILHYPLYYPFQLFCWCVQMYTRFVSMTYAFYCLPSPLLSSVHNLPSKKWRLQHRVVFFMHGLQYYLFENIDRKLAYGKYASKPWHKDAIEPPFQFLSKFYYSSRRLRDRKYSYFPYNFYRSIASVTFYEPRLVSNVISTYVFPLRLWRVLGVYYKNSHTDSKRLNRALFLLNSVAFISTNIVFNVYYMFVKIFNLMYNSVLSRPSIYETVFQTSGHLVIFFIAIPIYGAPSLHSFQAAITSSSAFNAAENLTAIQEILYSGNPLLLLVTVTGLLVALIGAAVTSKVLGKSVK